MNNTKSFLVVVAAAAVVMLMLQKTAESAHHVVGDDKGWTVPSNTSAYATWASNHKFVVGDELEFRYKLEDGVVVILKEEFDSCKISHPMIEIKA
ncbi:Cupredoxin [Parasponia andersonii]|uniref:Cupredoxin n=1 Tax=Parasponia andersonii TaxID=3476 RepID=A0A2P5CQB8_PARAD|nr:Cupredoxin [Parasponia andersonii]